MLAQLWRLTFDNKLVNKSGAWRFSDKIWSLSAEPDGEFLTIEDQESCNVLGVACNEKTTGTLVNLLSNDSSSKQKWYRSKKECKLIQSTARVKGFFERTKKQT